MKSSRLLWNSIGLISIIVTSVFIFGMGYAIKTVVFPQTSNISLPDDVDGVKEEDITEDTEDTREGIKRDSNNIYKDDEIHVLALGDSLTVGMGDQSSQGYVRHVQSALEKTNDIPVKLTPFAINGYKSNQLLDDISSQSGTIRAVQRADIILLTIGGNDLFSIGDEMDVDLAMTRFSGAIENVEQVLSNLSQINPQAAVYYIGLYNPFMELENSVQSSLFIQKWNQSVYILTNKYPNMTFVPTFDLFERNGKNYLSSDQFHPNQAGYEQIAQRVIQAIQ